MSLIKLSHIILLLILISEFQTPYCAASQEPQIIIAPWSGHKAIIRDLVFTADSNQLVSAGDDKVIRVWDIRERKIVRTIHGQIGPGNQGKIFSLALSPDNKILAIGGYLAGTRGQRHSIRLHNFEDGRVIQMLSGHQDVVQSLDFSTDGQRLVSGSADKKAYLWRNSTDGTGWALEREFVGHQGKISAVAFSPDGSHLVTGSIDQTARLWEVDSGLLIHELRGHFGDVRAAEYSPNGKIIATGSWDGSIYLWDAKSGDLLSRTFQGSGVASLAFSPNGKELLTGAALGNRLSLVLSIPSGKKRQEIVHDGLVLAAAYSPDGKTVITGGGQNFSIQVRDPRTFNPIAVLSNQGQVSRSLAFDANGSRLAFGNLHWVPRANHYGPLERTLRLKNKGTFQIKLEEDTLESEAGFRRVYYSHGDEWLEKPPDSYAYLNLMSEEGIIHKWGYDTSHKHSHVNAFSFSSDGKWVALGEAHGRLLILDPKTGYVKKDLVGHHCCPVNSEDKS